MTHAMTVRLDDETEAKLSELAAHYPSRSAAVQTAIRQAWIIMQEERLGRGYAAVVAENPHYPFESAEEARSFRHRRHRAAQDYE
jgi:Arc/MetJ-type ribon-helix-helix transcriptional regulator